MYSLQQPGHPRLPIIIIIPLIVPSKFDYRQPSAIAILLIAAASVSELTLFNPLVATPTKVDR